jgi:hypothetical protein
MRAKVAVATVQGKPYFLIVNELKQRSIPFISLVPGQSIRAEIRVVVTTPQECQLVEHPNIVVFAADEEPAFLGAEIQQMLRGKKSYDQVVIGVDPGEVIGLTVLGDDLVVDMANCYSISEVTAKIISLLKPINFDSTQVTVKIGSGVPLYKTLLEALDAELPFEVGLEIVGEAGTNHYTHGARNRRIFRHTISAMHIARRAGYVYSRRRMVEQES